MFLNTILFSALIYSVQGNGQFMVFSSPPSVAFQPGGETIEQYDIPEVLATSVGFSIQKESTWPQLSVVEPFNYAEGVFVIAVKGVSGLGSHKKSITSYPLVMNEDEEETWTDFKYRILERYPTQNNTLVRLDLELGGFKNEIDALETNHLDKDVEEDSLFLQQLVELEKLTDKLQDQENPLDGVPHLYWVVIDGLHAVSDFRGPHNLATVEAKELVQSAIERLASVAKAAYKDRVLVVAMVSDMTHSRQVRSVDGTVKADDDNSTSWNLATEYNSSYPAIFNIILWFSLAFVLSLIAVSIFIASMDPGRDSIIYRMTSNRMKKDS